ncbi:lysophospholipid acyltransferase family protein [Salisediminibacterium halotolerans]|uniref:1-acyl-sn-glycerol-3-phosphate acyltransferase n=1 Tax=Salisediminibacterium halotolerans TaxID=517425 RepID=A0A1H9UFX3_9BACI|nr:lysophospholipid acyltransferase family protein [Salisediminibacterium haloalkalitolerans]SES08440.1 1-acyl-sn-glycerol-3-phosphate acyltransferase [Salisediminibacterium haloalkalitolerans]
MLRTAVWFVYFASYLVAVLPKLWKAKRLKQKDINDYHDYIHITAKNWSSRLIKLAGGTVHVNGAANIPKDEPVLFVANHQGNFDIPVLLAHTGRKIGFISKMEVKKIPLIRAWMEHLDCVFIDRKNRRQAIGALLEGAEKLEGGRSLIIFPEGTRSKGGPVNTFKKGSFKMAEKSKATIVPVAIDGTYTMMEANENHIITPGEVQVTFLEPIRIHQYDANVKSEELASASEAAIAGKLAGLHPDAESAE